MSADFITQSIQGNNVIPTDLMLPPEVLNITDIDSPEMRLQLPFKKTQLLIIKNRFSIDESTIDGGFDTNN